MTPLDLANDYLVVVRSDVMTDGRACFVAEHPELPGCAAYGATESDAECALADARAVYLESLRATGTDIPIPERTAKKVSFTGAGTSVQKVTWSLSTGTNGVQVLNGRTA